MRISRLALGVAALLVAGVVAYAVQQGTWHLGGGPAGAAPDPAAAGGGGAAFAMPVPVTKVVRRTVPVHLEYAARAEAIRQITLQAKISGFLLEQLVPDGAEVAAGDLLYRIDPRDYQAALDQAKAQVQRDAASLDYVRSNLSRGNELTRTGYLSKDTFDQRTSAVRQAEAALAMGEAATRTAELNLSRTEIRAPFPGRLGRNQAPVGTLVSAASTVLNTLVQLAPLYVTFNPSETDVAAIQQARAKGLVGVDVLLPGGAGAPQAGEFTFVDNVIDRSTGTTTMRATVANPDRTLLPGQYARVRLKVRDEVDVPMVPQVAVGSSQLGKYVYLVGEGGKAEQRLVRLGPADGDLVAVLDGGVADGDLVISGNLQKIGPGAPVQPITGPPPG
jgi:multidrug efflux system membrane fusion protein